MRIIICLMMFYSCLYAHVVTGEVFSKMQNRLKENAQDAEALIICSHYYQNEENYNDAIIYVEKAVKAMGIKDPTNQPNLFIRLAQLYVNAKEYPQAIITFNRLLTKEFCASYGHIPVIQDAIMWRGKIYAELEEYEKAWMDASFVLKRNEKMPAYFITAAGIAEKCKKSDSAFDLYRRACIKFPTPENEPFAVRAINLVLNKEKEKAVALLNELEKVMPKEPYPNFYLAIIAKQYFQDENLFNKKKKNFLKITTEMNDKSMRYFWFAKWAFFEKKYEEAIVFLDLSIADDKRPFACYQLRSKINLLTGNESDAKKDIKKGQEMKKKSTFQWLFLCDLKKCSKKEKK